MKKSIIDLVEKATVLISMVALVVLNIDYFGTEEFGIELSYFLFLSILLTGNILRFLHFISKGYKFVSYVFILLVIGTVVYNLKMVSIFSFGYSFSGRTIPVIFYFLVVINIFLLIFSVTELIFNNRVK